MAARSGARLSGRSSARSVVLQAIIPQPMSTPTAAGMMARKVGITEPTVAPMPKCTSGIRVHRHAAHPALDGRAAFGMQELKIVFCSHDISPLKVRKRKRPRMQHPRASAYLGDREPISVQEDQSMASVSA
jgi:hypothetical protein